MTLTVEAGRLILLPVYVLCFTRMDSSWESEGLALVSWNLVKLRVVLVALGLQRLVFESVQEGPEELLASDGSALGRLCFSL